MNMTKVLTIASTMTGLLAVSMAAALYAPAVFAGESGRVVGEKLDSGLGALPSDYTGAEFRKSTGYRVLGEKLDSGLGELSSDYTGRLLLSAEGVAVPMPSDHHVLGEKLDSGLSTLSADYTGAEFSKASDNHVAGEKLDSGLGEISSATDGAKPALIQASN